VTADSPELIDALRERAARDRCRFTLLVPAPAGGRVGREAAQARVEEAVARMNEAGLTVEGQVGDHDVVAAVADTWDPREFDEVVVATLPTGSSKWLQVDLPHRVERLTGVPVHHVVARPPRPQPQPKRRERREEGLGLLTPLGALLPADRRRPSGPAHS